MLALDAARVASSFGGGLLAAINPCGFVMLPAYLTYFLGMESIRPGAQRGSVARALAVGTAVTAGFLAVFLVIGSISKWWLPWLKDRAPWVSLVIAALMVVLGVAMVLGYHLPVTTPRVDIGDKDRSARAMFVFGAAYAVASIGCTLPTFMGTVLGGLNKEGFVSGLAYIGVYGLSMGLVVIGLTVSLALANTWLLGLLRRGMQHVNTIAGVVLVLSGLYLLWYSIDEVRGTSNSVTSKALGWQATLSSWVDGHRTGVAVFFAVVIAGSLLAAFTRLRRHPS